MVLWTTCGEFWTLPNLSTLNNEKTAQHNLFGILLCRAKKLHDFVALFFWKISFYFCWNCLIVWFKIYIAASHNGQNYCLGELQWPFWSFICHASTTDHKRGQMARSRLPEAKQPDANRKWCLLPVPATYTTGFREHKLIQTPCSQ